MSQITYEATRGKPLPVLASLRADGGWDHGIR